MIQRALALSLIGLVFALSGCIPFRKRKVATLPPTLPPMQTVKVPSKPEVPPPPPKVDGTQPAPTVPAAVTEIPPETVPGPPPEKATPNKPRRTIKAQVSPPPVVETPAESPAGPTPAAQLGDFLSDEQRARLLADANDNMDRARKVLAQIEGKPLSNEQQDSIERVKTFIQQAEQARDRDPRTAVQLAQRADVLARDLAKVIR